MGKGLCVAAAVLLWAGFSSRARAEELTLPAETARGTYPPYNAPPLEARDEQIAWVEAMAALAAARPGTDLGGDLWISAADHAHRTMLDLERAAPLYRAALGAYAEGHPFAGIAILELGTVAAAQGNWDAAGEALTRFSSWRLREPVNADTQARTRITEARAQLADLEPELRIQWLEGRGKFAEAAEHLEARARATGRPADWRDAARAWALAGTSASALRAGEEALAVADTPEDRAAIRMWMLHVEAGALDEQGDLAPLPRWPGDAWHRKAVAFIDGLGADAAAVTYAVQMGFHFFGLGRYDEGMAMYERALRHTDVVRGAPKWKDPRSFLTMVHVARDAGRFADARRLLTRLRMIFGQQKVFDAAEIGVRSAAREAGRAPPPPPWTPKERAETPAPEGSSARIVPSAPEAAGDPADDDADEHERSGEGDVPPLLLGLLILAAIALLTLGAVSIRARRNR